jgi:hypothetical protein
VQHITVGEQMYGIFVPMSHNGQVGSSCLFENFEILLWSRYVPVAILQCVIDLLTSVTEEPIICQSR